MCLADSLSLTCTHGNTAGEQTRWIFSDPLNCIRVLLHVPPTGNVCGPFTLTNVSDNLGSVVTSSALTTATESLNGLLVQCLAGGLRTSPVAGSVTISVISEEIILLCLFHF